MTCGVWQRLVPTDQADQVAGYYKMNVPPPLSVTITPYGDGKALVVAVFPPCPPDTTHQNIKAENSA